MAATRKLQAEIDRCLKKVAEGVDKFDETWNKVHHASNSNQKEKYEEDLKKEIKKLQRLRDQIKTWIASGEIKDKSVLYEKRKLIEGKMERFKIVERETKTKAYSKEGLTSGQKLDPAERERCEISQWLNQCLENLNIQIDQFEAEIENLGTVKKKKGRNDQAEQIEQLNTLLEKHRDHVQKLESLLRMLDNDTVDINQIKDIKEDVEYYIENCQDPEFIENDMIYDDIDGLEEMLLDLGGHEHNTNSVEASETMSTNSASSPVPSYTHNHSNDATNDINEKRRHKSSSEDSKVSRISEASALAFSDLQFQVGSQTPSAVKVQPSSSSTTISAGPSPAAVPAVANASVSSAAVLQSASSSASVAATASNVASLVSSQNKANNQVGNNNNNAINLKQMPPSSPVLSSPPPASTNSPVTAAAASSSTPIKATFNTMVANPNNSSPSSGAMNGSSAAAAAASAVTLSAGSPSTAAISPTTLNANAPQNAVPGFPPTVASPATPLRAQEQQPNFAAAVQQLNGHASEGRSVPSPSPSLTGSSKQQATSSQSSHFSGAPMGTPASSTNDNDGMPTLKSIAQEATNRAGLKVPQAAPSVAAPGLPTQMPIGTTAPSISQVFSSNQLKERSQKTEAHIPPLMGVAPLGPVPLNKETQMQYAMLEAAYLHMPHPSDSERLRPYLPRNPCPTPTYYPQLPPSGSDEIEFFLRLSTETLFFIFYYMEGTKAQYLAAKALKRQSWRFHTKYLMWFQRHEEPKIINDEFEQGTYVYFDFEKWGQRKKEGFTFEYRFLEDRDLD